MGAAAPTITSGPLIGYVKHTKPPTLEDRTPGTFVGGVVGAVAANPTGRDIVVNNAIQDPSGDMAHEIATAYATKRGGHVADAPLLDDHSRTQSDLLASQAGGARYIVDVEPPWMTLVYFSFDWAHFDLMYVSRVRVIETADGKVVAQAGCFLRSEKTPGALTGDELLANSAAALKQLIVRKSEACVALMKTGLAL